VAAVGTRQALNETLTGRREEMLKITRIVLQSRQNNLILIGEPGVG
jgi:ATP-dependent Clp protease ATP-binding subunit ClpA